LSFLFLLGCSNEPGRVSTVKVKGKLFVDDKPFGGCKLGLTADLVAAGGAEKAVNASADVAEDGSFVLHTYTDDDGAAPGSYSVSIMGGGASSKNPADMMKQLPVLKPTKVVIPKEGYPNGFDLKCESTGEMAAMGAMSKPQPKKDTN